MSELLPCESSMGVLRGQEIQDFITRATGEPCPCREGKGCPLVASLGEQQQGAGRLTIPRARIGAVRFQGIGVLLTIVTAVEFAPVPLPFLG